jgi:hypothetical protein
MVGENKAVKLGRNRGMYESKTRSIVNVKKKIAASTFSMPPHLP